MVSVYNLSCPILHTIYIYISYLPYTCVLAFDYKSSFTIHVHFQYIVLLSITIDYKYSRFIFI